MILFVQVYLCFSVLGLLCRLIYLGVGDYPRVNKTSRASDVCGLVVAIAFTVWASLLLWGGQ